MLSVLAAVTAGHLVAGIVDPDASPVLAVGNAVRDLSPPSVTDFAIANLGDTKKALLFGGLGVVLLVTGAVAGLLSRRRLWLGIALAAAVGVVGLVAVLDQPTVGVVGVTAPLASTAAGVGVLWWLHTLATRPAPDSAARRRFLLTSAGVAVGAGVLGGAGQLLAGRNGAAASRAAVGPLTPAFPAPPIPAGADFAAAGTPRFLTSNRDFYRVDTALAQVPAVRAEDWTLRVHGMVERERTYSYADIRDRPLVERTITMTCVSNEVGGPYVSTANFVGVPLGDLLAEAGVRPGADQLFSTSVDGWTAGTPTEAVLDTRRGAMLALGMNGEPLPLEHGFPARLVVPGLYGFVSATKWVVDLELTTFEAKESYWLSRGWGRRAPIKTQSRIDAPRGFATVPAGRVTLAGVAWAQHIGVQRVEVRVDGGPWRTATLATEVNVRTWRMWRLDLRLEPGQHRAEVRATDRRGRTQTDARVAPIPDGATGWHSVQFSVA
ncbi:molybdopterin-binding protein [Actinophytocola xanthii]|uniref:Molybdopterin-binding protein n=1 Tax=Actinophytocola xanthii TaxID=1912961 RepID=A0A1Q8CE35_9PSEU|nr:molybdopterin-binding protein [Actinophytocola xanthii]